MAQPDAVIQFTSQPGRSECLACGWSIERRHDLRLPDVFGPVVATLLGGDEMAQTGV